MSLWRRSSQRWIPRRSFAIAPGPLVRKTSAAFSMRRGKSRRLMAIGYPDFDGSATMSPADPITSRPSPRQAEWAQARLAAISVRLARAGHDLRGILAPALPTAERLQMHDDPAIKRAGDRVARSVDRATDLV